MLTTDVQVKRVSIVSPKPFDEVLEAVTITIGRPDMSQVHAAVSSAKTLADLRAVVGDAIGSSGLMEFARFDSGAILRKAPDDNGPRMLRLLVGNPLILKDMASVVPDAASYAPVTLLIDERSDGVHVSYDLMADSLMPYGNSQALLIARNLDAKIVRLLEDAAR